MHLAIILSHKYIPYVIQLNITNSNLVNLKTALGQIISVSPREKTPELN